jgi:Ca2+-binding RTX toxin-like protein
MRRRRAPMLLAAIAVMVALFATAAYAAVITGTPRSDFLYESKQNDTIYGRGGSDDLRADRFPFDKDYLKGGTGVDELNARDGDESDTLDGGKGFDKCRGDQFDNYKSCELRP